MQLAFLVLLSSIAYSYAGATLGWTANFSMVSTANASGITYGTVRFRWSENDAVSPTSLTRFMFEIKYQNPSGTMSTELYQYNSNGGYIETSSQTKYSDDTACTPTCSTSGIPFEIGAMPPIDPTLAITSGVGTSVTGVSYSWSGWYSTFSSSSTFTCAQFVPKKAGLINRFTASRSSNVFSICGFVIDNGCISKTFTLFNFVRTVPTIAPPPSCKCDTVLDVMIVLDSSGSITPVQTKLFHQFLVNFLSKLNIAPNNVNVGIVWFHKRTGYMILPSGNPEQIARAISNCTGTGNTIGSCATPVGQTPPFQTPCAVKNDDGRCPDTYIPMTCTGAGVLYGSHLLFSSSQQRKVPKLFITMTDGAVNTLVEPNTIPTNGFAGPGVPQCDDSCNMITESNNCTGQLKDVIKAVNRQYNNWLTSSGCTKAQCPLTFLSVGIGIELGTYCDPNNPQTANYRDPQSGRSINWIDSYCEIRTSINRTHKVCWDSNFCLSNQHLDVLANGTGQWQRTPTNPNVLSANNWQTLNNEFIPKLLALSCPDNQYSACQCEQGCGGVCSGACNKCNPPSNCTPVDNTCYTVGAAPVGDPPRCPQIPKENPCPAPQCNCSKCVSYTCNSTGSGFCQPFYYNNPDPCPPVAAPGGGVSCKTMSCNANTGLCDIPNTNACEPCVNLTGECTGASCGPPRVNGTRKITQVSPGTDFCKGSQGSEVTESCCVPCSCSVGDWGNWNYTCSGCADTATKSRTRTITSAACGGSNEDCNGVPLTEELSCVDECVDAPCVYNWGSWACDCETGTATRPVIIITPPRGSGTPCPPPEEDNCVCCLSNWTQTPCDCDTHTYDRVWQITTPASGPAALNCTEPEVTEYLDQPCQAQEGCAICISDEDCNDNNACTQDICDNINGTDGSTTVNKHCRNPSNASSCDLSSVCNTGYCDPNVGCQTTPLLFCDDGNVCTDDACDDTTGCVYTESEISKNCSLNVPTVCNYALCDPFVGCDYGNIQCNTTGEDNCTIAGCDPDWNSTDPDYEPLCKCENPTGPCYEYDICGLDVGVIIGLTAGGIAALVVCLAFLAFLILSGGTYALAQQVRSNEDTQMSNNPLYQDKGTHGTNVFHAGNCD